MSVNVQLRAGWLLLGLLFGLTPTALCQMPSEPNFPEQRRAELPMVVPLDFPGASLSNDEPPFLAGVAVDHASHTYLEGEKLRVQFMAERESHLYLIYHQADGSSLLLFPNEAHRNSRVAGGRPVVIPPPGEDFRFRIRPPFGTEVLQGVASMEPLAELESLVARRGSAPPVPAALLKKLTGRLAADRSRWTEHRLPIRTLASDNPSPQRTPARVGLFIGIGQYQHPEFAPTHVELRRSAEIMHDLMLRHGDLDPRRTLLVCDEKATKANLQKLIAHWLPSVTEPGDTVFLYYSGHAGQLDTGDRTEPDGKDEAIGPYDLEGGREGESREQALARFQETNITDDTLARWLENLQGRHVVLVFDTCHSGGLVGGKGAIKSLLDGEAARVKDIAQLNTIVLTSCAADEQSLFEGTRNQTMWFTYCLTEAIEAAAGKQPLTVQGAGRYAQRRMRQLLEQANAPREQEPTLQDNLGLPVLLIP